MGDLKFPSKDDFHRLAILRKYKQLYEGEHYKVFGLKNFYVDGKRKEKLLYIAVNLPATICDYYADMVVGEGVFFDVQDPDKQTVVNEIVEDNDLNVAIYESAITQSNCGFTVFRVRRNEEDPNKAVIEEVPVDQYFPQYSGTINPKLEEVCLASFVHIIDERGKKQKCLYKQVYSFNESGEVMFEHQLWTVNSQGEAEEPKSLALLDPSLPEGKQNTGFTEIPVWQINNSKTSRDLFGKSDLKDPEPLFEELNNRVTQISIQLIKYLNAKMAVPQDTLDENGEVKASEADMIEVGNGEFVPQFITNSNPQIDKGFEQIEFLIRQISAITKVPMDALGLDASSGAEKVEAMKIRLFNTTRKVNRKRVYMDQPLIDMMEFALEIQEAALEEGQNIKLIWDDVLPVDDLAITNALVQQTAAGLKSKKTAVKELQEIIDEELDEELAEIQRDNTPVIAAFASQPPRISNTDQIVNRPPIEGDNA